MSNYPAGVTDSDPYFNDDPDGVCQESCCVEIEDEPEEAPVNQGKE